jgi:hypothetical protein
VLAWRRERTPTGSREELCAMSRVGEEGGDRKGGYEGEGEAQEERWEREGFERFFQPVVGGAPHKIMRGRRRRVGRTNSCASFAATDKDIGL